MRDDPCFHCPLPDCDEDSPQCAIKQLHLQYERKRRSGCVETATEAERLAHGQWFRNWHLERMAQAADGVRPYKRAGSPWKGSERTPERNPMADVA